MGLKIGELDHHLVYIIGTPVQTKIHRSTLALVLWVRGVFYWARFGVWGPTSPVVRPEEEDS